MRPGEAEGPGDRAGLPAGGVATVPEPAGYRMDEYRAPTPAALAGATTVDTMGAKALFTAGQAVFVDTLPRAPRPKGLPETTIWRPKVRNDIPGSIWLVDTGYGALAPEMEHYFFEGLSRATLGDKAKPVLFYCLSECWMSWNAAKRAMAAGYTAVHWYPEGTDGWAANGLPLERREPEPRPDE
ncbi:MAG: PQQ-dependent catabolism-associated CXXCW motif protein [Rhizobiaceae bacterium]|nr:PQQ-dependent catabolism-associated CXXCW motif protein [Rhizobiaceae bacterium]